MPSGAGFHFSVPSPAEEEPSVTSCCIYRHRAGGYLPMREPSAFEITWDDSDGDVELTGPLIKPMRFSTVREAYLHWKQCFAPLSDAPLVVHAKGADRAMMRV